MSKPKTRNVLLFKATNSSQYVLYTNKNEKTKQNKTKNTERGKIMVLTATLYQGNYYQASGSQCSQEQRYPAVWGVWVFQV